MTKFQKWILAINVAILIIVAIRLIFFNNKEGWTPPPLIDNSAEIKAELDSIKNIHINLDSLKEELRKKDLIINSKNASLIKLKERYEKEKYDISLLPADESIEFFTEFIRKEE